MKVITPSRPCDVLPPPAGIARNRCTRLASVFALVVLITTTASAAFWNLTGAVVTHDPSIIKEGSTWWIFETGVGLPVKFSSNGTAWNQGVRIFANDLAWWNTYVPNGSRDPKVWAPDIQKFGSRTYC